MSIPIPPQATRVQVEDEYGKRIWRKPSEVLDTDTIRINSKSGQPYVMYGTPGLPSTKAINTKSPPLSHDNINQRNQRKLAKLKSDSIFKQTKKNSDDSSVLTQVLIGLAEESASLAFEREEAERKGDNTSNISMKRVSALRAVGETWLKKKEIMDSKSIDLESKAFKHLFGHIAETFRKACDEAGVRPELSENIFATFGRIVDDPEWIIEAKKVLRRSRK